MKIVLPEELEQSIRAEVQSGQFTSADDLVAQAVRVFLHHPADSPIKSESVAAGGGPDPILGLMRADLELMDEIVADAYRQRQTAGWREVDVE